MKFKNIDIFSPYILLFGVILYLSLAVIALKLNIKGLMPYSVMTYYTVFYGSVLFFMGILFAIFIQRYLKIKQSKFNINRIKKINQHLSYEKIVLILVLMGILLQVINIYFIGGIPLFSGYLKAKAVTKIWFISYIIFLPSINLLLAKFNRKWYYALFFVGFVLFALTGYRTTTMAILMSVFITSYYVINLKFKYIVIFSIFILISGLALGFMAVMAIEWQQWALNPLDLFLYRAGYTLNVLDRVVELQGATTGSLFYYTLTGFFESADPRIIIGETVLKYRVSTTSTIFGPALLDWGYIALGVQMFLLGFFLKLLHILQKIKKGIFTAFYSVILAHSLIWIETGPTDLVVWIFFILSLFLMLICYEFNIYTVNKTGDLK
ncbi:MAG: oligosaccharide repeat unit polymerase family protein [Methanobacteriaceae archaeon]|nr:oligosaccharide repeat unit polymerase family protein [Methanobacteriaceae archaeon]